MDVLDAGVFTYKFVAAVPKEIRVVLWGPLQAKEMGFHGWTYQDGGETGFVYHSDARGAKMGTAHATLIVVRRLARATLTIYLAGYPSDAAREQRIIDIKGVVGEAELFLSKIAGENVRFELADERALVDNAQPARPAAPAPAARQFGRVVKTTTKPATWEV